MQIHIISGLFGRVSFRLGPPEEDAEREEGRVERSLGGQVGKGASPGILLGAAGFSAGSHRSARLEGPESRLSLISIQVADSQ